jgi:hypothetical protein
MGLDRGRRTTPAELCGNLRCRMFLGQVLQPLFNQASSMARPALAENARIVCEESGVCYRLPGRRPVARWIYGDGAFYGPYDGPRYYGWPGRRYGWSFLGLGG